MQRHTTRRAMSRVIAVALVTLFTLALTTSAYAAGPVPEPGGDHGACTDGLWWKADWNGEGWDWEAGPDWGRDPQSPPLLTILAFDENDPLTVSWDSLHHVLSVGVKASTEYATHDGGWSGTAMGIQGHAISHLVFCYGPASQPEVTLEKAWFTDPDAPPIAIFREGKDGWELSQDGPKGYVPSQDFVQPADFDLSVSYGEKTYTVTEIVPAGWEPMTCPADAPMPNGLGTFPYEKPDVEKRIVDDGYPNGDDGPPADPLRHTVCNVQVPDPSVPDIALTKTPDVESVTYDPDDGDDETITYTYTVTNTGQTDLAGLTLTDDVLGTITLPSTDLAVGATLEVDAVHVVTTADAAAEEVVNTATVTGTAPDETTVEDSATARVVVDRVEVETNPAITLDKTALVPVDDDGTQVVIWSSDAPDATTITYEYVITNTGDTALTAATLVDDVLGTIELSDTDLDIGESTTVTAVHTVTAGDAEAGQVDNTAVATARAPDGTDVSDTADASVLVGEVLAEVLDTTVAQETLPAAGVTSTVLALSALAGITVGAALLAVARRRA